ncbi:helicase-like protein [Nocardiopsis sp. Huas11]|uniref:helicase-related protein n=1 Tax=Nocardiopsis sp. Huas11 TaxID=2183912 RepID=UPI000EB58E93|nr:helicase-related protein [Nocardiopsis sp. Huas11]RKS05903.1 helicase-like protein [Nocardiopsis sp. Huas11]
MTTFHESREDMHRGLVHELVGPGPRRPGRLPIDPDRPVVPDEEAATKVWFDAETGEEILTGVRPTNRYGVGVLYPALKDSEGTRAGQSEESRVGGTPGLTVTGELSEPSISDTVMEQHFKKLAPVSGSTDDSADEDLDLSLANAFDPSSLGVSVNADLPDGARLVVRAEMGRYEKLTVTQQKGGKEYPCWVRKPVTVTAVFAAEDLRVEEGRRRKVTPTTGPELVNEGTLSIDVDAFSRTIDGNHLITFVLTNRSETTGRRSDDRVLFQAGFDVIAEGAAFAPYPELRTGGAEDEERQELAPAEEAESIALLYRRHQTFALGHGCAADWEKEPGETVSWVRAECLPSYEAPSITPTILLPCTDRRPGADRELTVDMRPLADRERWKEANEQVKQLLDGYDGWIKRKRREIGDLPERHRAAAERHMADCEAVLGRMRRGWRRVHSDPEVATAFRLANRAMLDQQARAALTPRPTIVEPAGLRIDEPFPTGEVPVDRGKWRPFQIAFLLSVLVSIADCHDEDRELVDLIFFPTGGGKTEAYLGAASFAMFLRRLRDPRDIGTDVLMRYTLRLLTAQQFLRASSLICAMERIRDRRPERDLGGDSFSIGVWLGSATTPNRHDGQYGSVKLHQKLCKEPATAANKFLLTRCPWCAATMGPTEAQRKAAPRSGVRRQPAIIPGYVKEGNKVVLKCPDRRCPFRDGLPLLVVDEDIYESPPSMVIGTVDKFAMLPWRPEARALFGLGPDGNRRTSPPSLIIQDEFHLISGPLGSMVGLYEGIVEALCIDHSQERASKPKIVSSTATIMNYREQTQAVYARQRVALFPPPGLEASDSYFSTWARNEAGQLLPGRRYVGVHAPTLGSMQTLQVRAKSALLHTAANLDEEQRDPWWTNVCFLNSFRELGNSLSLLQSDIPDYLRGIRRRERLDTVRYLRNVMELTGRRRNDEIPRAIDELSTAYESGQAVDVCLASNIIEVGVDIDRLSLMTVVGQPKTTAQYIQVTGRVGRRWFERPGLVVMLYGAAKPRDRSHFERFRSYHERLYAQVEPTSVTPFAKPVTRRALHAAVIAHIRLTQPDSLKPFPYPEHLVRKTTALLQERVEVVDPEEYEAVQAELERAEEEWRAWQPTDWEANPYSGDPLNGLMRYAGKPAPDSVPSRYWEVPTSMRDVDTECRVTITQDYHQEGQS